MKNWLVSLVAVFAIALVLGGCSQSNSTSSTTAEETTPAVEITGEAEKVSVDDLDTSTYQVIDIREEDQFIGWDTDEGSGGHIVGAIDFPETWLDMDLETESAIGTTMSNELERRGIDLSAKTVLYTNGDVSSEQIKKYQSLGFSDLYILDGGYDAYVNAGGDTTSLEHYEMYVSPQWVQDLIDGKNPETYDNNDYVVLEVSLSSETDEYANGHIPGALNVSADVINHVPGLRNLADYEDVPLEEQLTYWNRPSDENIQSILENLGITKNTTVIVYGTTAATTAAARAAAIMKYAGVEDIRILNGGKTLWNLQGRELETTENTREAVDFGTTVPANPDVFYDYDEELAAVNNDNAVIASIRSWAEYTGEVSGYTYIGEAGDIAKARFGYAGSDPYSMEDYRNVDNTMFNYELIQSRWELWGITPDKLVSFHCGTGWRASEAYFIAYALGYEDIHIYDGGWYEWSKIDDSPRKEAGVPDDAPEQEPQEYFIVSDD